MEVVYVLLPLSLLFVGISIALFVWAVKRGQFDDLETPAVRMLFDDEPAPPEQSGTDALPEKDAEGSSTSTSTSTRTCPSACEESREHEA